MTKSIWKFIGGIFSLLLVTLFLLPAKNDTLPSQAERLTNNNRSFSAIDNSSTGIDGDIWVSELVIPTNSPPITELPTYKPEFYLDREINPRLNLSGLTDKDIAYPGGILGGVDPLLKSQQKSPAATDLAFLTPILNFNGQGFTNVNPPDTVGDVGPNHYIQIINGGGGGIMKIYDKTGNTLAGPTALDTLGTGACANGLGDGIVLYDQMADRWMLSEFSGSSNALCVYISNGANPVTSSWYAYQFNTPNFPDYPKYGVWPDAYYVSSNENSPAVYALDRTKMLNGQAATSQRFTAPSLSGFGFQALIPSDLDGATAPPAGTPNYFMRHRDDEAHNPGSNNPTQDYLEIWSFDVDFATPANSSFSGPINIPVAEFDSELCGYVSFQCFPQQGSGTTLDPLREVIMQRLQYRNFGTHEVLVGNFVTDVDGTNHGGVRWFELRKSGGGSWSLYQEGTYAPDANNRWMGAISMDGAGNIAVGYNVTSSSMYPSLRYAGRLASDPLGTLPQGEGTLIDGSAANSSNRYGDYSAMSVDPADDCTFWFTGEYNANSTWSTRIGTFKFDSCGSSDFTISATPPELAVCSGSNAVYTVNIGQVGGFTGNVTLSSSGTPVGTTTGFAPNPVAAPGSSQMTISNIGGGAGGSHTINISGNASSGSHATQVDLDVYTAVPTAPNLTSPANNATGVNLSPTFTWTAVAQAVYYNIDIATDSGFTNIVDSAAALTGTSYTTGVVLNQQTTYYWRVRAENPCGNGGLSTVSIFTTTNTVPPALFCSTPNLAIPDVTPAGVSDQITVSSTATLSDLDVYIDTDHTWVGDLIYTLKHVNSGTEVTLINRPGYSGTGFGCSGDDIDATIDDEGTAGNAENMCDNSPAIHDDVVGGDPPNNSLLSAFNGESFAGNWTLSVSDNQGGDVGVLKEWCLVPNGGGGDPDIVVDPTTIQSNQPVNTTSMHTLEISNVGEVPLNWTINEVNTSNSPPQYGPDVITDQVTRQGTAAAANPDVKEKLKVVPDVDAITDGGFEAGPSGGIWTESSTNFGTPICDVGSCGTGTGTGPHDGNYWAWFGGIGAYEEGSVSQNVTIPTGTATLTFWLEQIACDSAADYIELLIDGNQLFLTDGSSSLCGSLGYTQQTIDVSAYADGGTHSIEFHSEIFANNGGGSNFFVDDIVLDAGGEPGVCESPSNIPWATVTPGSGTTAPLGTTGVDVTFNSIGLATGNYSGILCVESNDPDEPLVEVPLSMQVGTADYHIFLPIIFN